MYLHANDHFEVIFC